MADKNKNEEPRKGGEGQNRRGHNTERKSPYQEIPNKPDASPAQKTTKENKGKKNREDR